MKFRHLLIATTCFCFLPISTVGAQTSSTTATTAQTKGPTEPRRRGTPLPTGGVVSEPGGGILPSSLPNLLRLGVFSSAAKTDEGQLFRLNKQLSSGDLSKTPTDLVLFASEREEEVQALIMAINSANHASIAIARLDIAQTQGFTEAFPASFISPQLFQVLPAEQYRVDVRFEFAASRSTSVTAIVVEYASPSNKSGKPAFETFATLFYEIAHEPHAYRSFDSEKCRHLPCSSSPENKPWYKVETAPFFLMPPPGAGSVRNHGVLSKPNYLLSQHIGEPIN